MQAKVDGEEFLKQIVHANMMSVSLQIAEVYKEMLERLLEEVPQVVSVYECRGVLREP